MAGIDAVTGGFGYSGSHIARRLLARGRRVRTLTRSSGEGHPLRDALELHPLDFDRPDSIGQAQRSHRVPTPAVRRPVVGQPAGVRAARGHRCKLQSPLDFRGGAVVQSIAGAQLPEATPTPAVRRAVLLQKTDVIVPVRHREQAAQARVGPGAVTATAEEKNDA